MRQEVIFKLNSEDYGIEIMNVNEIIRMQELTAMPNTAPYILGVTNIRGKVIPVISLKVMLGMETMEDDDRTRIIVISYEDKMYGFKVDAVSEIIKIEDDQIESQGSYSGEQEGNLVLGIAKVGQSLVKLLDIEKIIKNC